METSPILQVKSLVKAFRNPSGKLLTVDNINFTVKRGEFLCIIGPSGCGKTTLLQMLGGLERPTSGQIFLANQPLFEPHPDISIVFQKPNLMPWRTVLENVSLPLEINNGTHVNIRKKSLDMLSKVALTEFADSYPKELSGGMEQRVAVARALVQQPKVLLLDEPFGALDALTREKLNLELLKLWRDQNITAIMVTHNIREAVLMADRVFVLSPRPAKISTEISIDLPRPRHQHIEYTPDFVNCAIKIRQSIGE